MKIKDIEFINILMILLVCLAFFAAYKANEGFITEFKRAPILSHNVSEKYPELAECMQGDNLYFASGGGVKLSSYSKNSDLLVAINTEDVSSAIVYQVDRMWLEGNVHGGIDVMTPDSINALGAQKIYDVYFPVMSALLDKAVKQCQASTADNLA